MKNLKYILSLLSILMLLLYCGKSNNTTKSGSDVKSKDNKSISETNETKFSNYKVDENGKRIPEIKAVTFTGKPFEHIDLRADVHLSIPFDDAEFKFLWVVNDKVVKDVESDTLPNEFIKHGDWVFCKAKIVNEKIETGEVKSKYTKILGATPILDLDPVPEISVPGEFRYRINAHFPGEDVSGNDSDSETDPFSEEFIDDSGLEFTLISPTDKGIFLDSQTGEIVWSISNSLVLSIGNKVEIKFKVSNPEGGSITSSISISFKSPESDEVPMIHRSGMEIE